MKKYLYLLLTPEALIGSQLPPEEFGNYLAVSTKKRNRGQAIFFEVNPELMDENFPRKRWEDDCIPHNDGTPKRSLYLSIYRVLEKMPLKALMNLYLTTDDGRVLGLEQSEYNPEGEEKGLHLYQQLCPVTPRIASKLNPFEFMHAITDTTRPVSVPKLIFVELLLNNLGTEPKTALIGNLPYSNIDHLRDCLIGLQTNPEKPTKTVMRFFQNDLLYRTCKNGFFVGSQTELLYYHFPSLEELEERQHAWLRSALTVGFRSTI
jgi:hypothetical protein